MNEAAPYSMEAFNELSLEQQRSLLAHPVWRRRCFCKRYGSPWDEPVTIIVNGPHVDETHTEAVCGPTVEFP